MDECVSLIEHELCQNIDPDATVCPLNAPLSPFLSGAYELYEARLLDKKVVLARPKDKTESDQDLVKRAGALAKALNKSVALCLPPMTRQQRRALIKARQGFIAADGSFFLPELSLFLAATTAKSVDVARSFTPAQQAVFLYCLYADSEPIFQADAQNALGISSGSASSAFSVFTSLGLLECTIGGKTGRKKGYRIGDKKRFFSEGSKRLGPIVREMITAPVSVVKADWLKTGFSALSELSDLLPPELPEYAISFEQAKEIAEDPEDAASRCRIKVLRYDPRPFAANGRVDPVTMMLTIDEEDERTSLALRQALGDQAWYQG